MSTPPTPEVSVSSLEGDENALMPPVDPDMSLIRAPCVVCELPAIVVCGGCKQQNYCSPRCQTTDWLENGHREMCYQIARALRSSPDPHTDLTSVHCSVCQKPASLKCRGCGQQKYCSPQCIATDWEEKGHQEKCSDIMKARADLSHLLDMFPEMAEYNHMTRASVEKELIKLPDRDDATLVKTDSIIVNIMKINAEMLGIDIERVKPVGGRYYVVANHIITKCLDKLSEDVLEPYEQARALGVDVDDLIAERKRAQEEREDEERRAEAARDVDAERAELELVRAEIASERANVAEARVILNQDARTILNRGVGTTINTGSLDIVPGNFASVSGGVDNTSSEWPSETSVGVFTSFNGLPQSDEGRPSGHRNSVLRALDRVFGMRHYESVPSTPTTSVNYPAEWLTEPDKPEGLSGAGTCSVCMDRQVATIIEGCWHACMCVFCTRELMMGEVDRRKCPMCRKPIQKVNRIFMNDNN